MDGNTFERTAGLISWGQWRGWGAADSGGETGFGAIDGEGAQPSWFNAFTRNSFPEPGVVNYATTEALGGYDFGRGYNLASVSGAFDGEKHNSPGALSMNSFNVFRGNRILANGGILIAGDSSNTVVEGNVIEYPGGYRGQGDDLGICIQNGTSNILVRANDAPVLTGGLCGEVPSAEYAYM